MNKVAATAYRLAPAWLQNVLLSGFASVLERQRYGGRYPEFQALLSRMERASRDELLAYQDERLRAVVRHAYDTVPFYRQRFDALKITPADIRGRADLPKIPLLTRDEIRTRYHDLRSSAVDGGRVYEGHTSGTTGTPLTIAYDKATIWMTYAVFDRHYRWAGCRLAYDGDRVAVARGNVIVPPTQSSPPFWRHNWRQNQLLLSSFHMSRQHLPAYVDAMRRFGATVIDGYPSTLYLLAKFLQSVGETLPLRAAITSSETLYDFQRAVIEERFECRVHDYYALAERVTFSHECVERGHHLAMEYAITEIVDDDGQPVPAGSPGRLVGTTLHNSAMPLLRYATTDVSAVSEAVCACRRASHLMAAVTTKAEDCLTLPDGRVISPSVLTHPFKPLDSIEGSQIVQTRPDCVVVRLVAGPGYAPALTDHLKRELGGRLGPDVEVRVEFVDRLESQANGKFKWVISHVPLGV